MNGPWLQDIESLEAISQDDDACALFLRMARMAQNGRLEPFLRELEDDAELDDDTKANLSELAQDSGFLYAVEEYVRRTRAVH